MMRRRTPVVLAAGLLIASCSSGDDDTVLVLAASSLANAFEQMKIAFEQANPGVDVDVNVAGSNALRLQIDQGAPADVVAVANEQVMTELAGEGHVMDPIVFATNELVVAKPTDGDAAITDSTSLADPELLVGLCAIEVPCGRYASEALDRAGIEPSVDTYEPDVRSLTMKLAIGELDVGVIYATDAAARPADVMVIATLGGDDARYPIAAVTDAPNAEQAAAFVDFVLSAQGQAIMESAGFGAP